MAQKQLTAIPAASAVADSDLWHVKQTGIDRSATVLQLLSPVERKDVERTAHIKIEAPTSGTIIIIDLNRQIGTIVGVDARMVVGSCTATWQIADDNGSSATSITGLSSLSVTTTRRSDTASAANIMLKTGSVDRQLLLVLASATGAGPLLIGLRFKGT